MPRTSPYPKIKKNYKNIIIYFSIILKIEKLKDPSYSIITIPLLPQPMVCLKNLTFLQETELCCF